MASLQTLRNASGQITGYRVAWRSGGRGAKLQTTPKFDTKEQAWAAKDRVEADVAAAQPMRRGVLLPLVELLTRWKAWKISTAVEAGYAPAYIEHRRLFAEMARSRVLHHVKLRTWSTLADLTASSIAAWRAEVPRTQGAARYLLGLLKYARDYCDQTVDPKALVALRPKPRARKEPGRLLTDREVADIEKAANKLSLDAGALVHFLATYGARPITAASLTCQDFDQLTGSVVIAVKSGDQLRFPLLPKTVNLFAKMVKGRKPTDPLFLDPRYGEGFAIHARQLLADRQTERPRKLTGIYPKAGQSGYEVKVKIGGKQVYGGYHRTLAEAKKARAAIATAPAGPGFTGFTADHDRYGRDYDKLGHGFAGSGARDISAFFRTYLGEKSYNLKRYAITTMLTNGVDVKTIMLFTGHRTEAQVLKYARTSQDKARAALGQLAGAVPQKRQSAASTKAKPDRALKMVV